MTATSSTTPSAEGARSSNESKNPFSSAAAGVAGWLFDVGNDLTPQDVPVCKIESDYLQGRAVVHHRVDTIGAHVKPDQLTVDVG